MQDPSLAAEQRRDRMQRHRGYTDRVPIQSWDPFQQDLFHRIQAFETPPFL